MTERDTFEARFHAAVHGYAGRVSSDLDAAQLAHRIAVTEPRGHGRAAILGWRGTAVPRVAWVLLLGALLTAMVAGMLVVGSQPEAKLPAVGPAFECPPGSSPDEPAPGAATAGAAGVLAQRRVWHTASLLPGGCVLVVGGMDFRPPDPFSFPSAELWDPACRCFRPAGELIRGRHSHTATALVDGRVLVTGGLAVLGPSDSAPEAQASVEIWDPASRTFSGAGAMSEGRSLHTATLLDSGDVLIIGGSGAELWNPATGAFSSAGMLIDPRVAHTATMLPDGRVLVIGGITPDGVGPRSHAPTAELWNPRTLAFEPAGVSANARKQHTATVLPDGRVLVVGGLGGDARMVRAAEVWDPGSRSFAVVGSSVNELNGHTAAMLADGRVLLIGVSSAEGDTGAEVFDPRTGAFSPAGSPIDPRAFHTATQLPDGRILLIGGSGGGETLARAELLDPSILTPP
jgi:hypothetical protein